MPGGGWGTRCRCMESMVLTGYEETAWSLNTSVSPPVCVGKKRVFRDDASKHKQMA